MRAWKKTLTSVAVSRPGTAALRVLGRRTLVCLGDSHLRPMRLVRREKLLPKTTTHLIVVSGASAYGIANAGSQTQALHRFRGATARLRPDSTVLMSLGEVDVGFLAFMRARQAGGSPQDYADVSFERYTSFLTTEILPRTRSLLLLSAIPPTVQDYSVWTEQQNARRHLRTPWQERADMTADWNGRLASWCAHNGAVWLDMTPHVTEPGTMRVRPEWLHPDAYEQHLHPQLQARLMANLLREQGFS